MSTNVVILGRKIIRVSRLMGEFTVVGSAAATATNYPTNFFIAPYPCRILAIRVRYAAGSTSGTLKIVKCVDGVAVASGTAMHAGTIRLAATADTTIVTAPSAGNAIGKGEALGAIAAGTLTNQSGVMVSVEMLPLEWDASNLFTIDRP